MVTGAEGTSPAHPIQPKECVLKLVIAEGMCAEALGSERRLRDIQHRELVEMIEDSAEK
jgi:hypothetical protein